MSEHKQLRVRAMLVYFGVVVFAIAIAVRLFQIQLVEGDKWRAKAESVSTTWRTVQPDRGHIYSEDGRLLATSVPEYDVRMDLATDALTDERFNANIDSLHGISPTYSADWTARRKSTIGPWLMRAIAKSATTW